MRCDDVNRWMDEGMPGESLAAVRAHAMGCAACARAIEAAETLERALLAAPAAPPGGADRFVAGVLARIRVEDTARTARAPWWLGLLAEPAFVGGAAMLAAVLLLPPFVRAGAGRGLALSAGVLSDALSSATGRAASAMMDPLPLFHGVDPVARVIVMTGFAALLVWGGLAAMGSFDRRRRRPSERSM